MTWQLVSFDNAFPSVWECCWFLWQCQVSGTLSQLGKYWEPLVGCRVWVGECFILPKPGGRTGLLLALQNGGIWLPVPAGMSLSCWLTLSWYCPTPSYALSPAGASPRSQELLTCRGSHPNKHVSTCCNPVDPKSVRFVHVIKVTHTLRGFEVWLRCWRCLPDVLVGGLEVSLVVSHLQAPIMLDICNAFSCVQGKGTSGRRDVK